MGKKSRKKAPGKKQPEKKKPIKKQSGKKQSGEIRKKNDGKAENKAEHKAEKNPAEGEGDRGPVGRGFISVLIVKLLSSSFLTFAFVFITVSLSGLLVQSAYSVVLGRHAFQPFWILFYSLFLAVMAASLRSYVVKKHVKKKRIFTKEVEEKEKKEEEKSIASLPSAEEQQADAETPSQ